MPTSTQGQQGDRAMDLKREQVFPILIQPYGHGQKVGRALSKSQGRPGEDQENWSIRKGAIEAIPLDI